MSVNDHQMTKKDRANWKTEQAAEDAGYDPKAWRGLQVHSQNTPKHEFAKFALCYALDMRDREWDTEVQCNTGRVDVFDYGPMDGKPVVYEIETDVTPAQKRKKVEQYHVGPIRDVFVIDPADVPDDYENAIAYFSSQVIVG